MFKESPTYWLVLGIAWSITLFVKAREYDFAFNIVLVLIGLLALSSYVVAIFFAIKSKSLREDNNEKDS